MTSLFSLAMALIVGLALVLATATATTMAEKPQISLSPEQQQKIMYDFSVDYYGSRGCIPTVRDELTNTGVALAMFKVLTNGYNRILKHSSN